MEAEWQRKEDWAWEGNIQAQVLEHLQESEGFTILSPGEATPAEVGLEIVAEGTADGRTVHRLISVRGWPSRLYTRGSRAGQPRADRAEVLARTWIAQAVLDVALGRGADPEVDLRLALPAMASYIRYLQRLRWFLAAGRVAVYLVAQEGRVTVIAPGAPPVKALVAGDIPPTPTRRKVGLPGASRLQLPVLHALASMGGAASRGEVIASVSRWFPDVSQPPPAEFGQRVSVAQRTLQIEGLSELEGRGLWRLTEAGHAAHAAQWAEWLRREDR